MGDAPKSKVQLAEQAVLACLQRELGQGPGQEAVIAIEKLIFGIVEAGVEAASPGLLVPIEQFAFGKIEKAVEDATAADLSKIGQPAASPPSPPP
jgi:hypothetical protein